MALDPNLVQFLSVVLAPSGAVALAAKLVLNGTKQRVIAIDERTKNIDTEVKTLHVRVDALELEGAFEKGREAMKKELQKSNP